MIWLAKEADAFAEACVSGGIWSLIFWGGHEYLGHSYPHWIDLFIFLGMALGFKCGGAALRRIRWDKEVRP